MPVAWVSKSLLIVSRLFKFFLPFHTPGPFGAWSSESWSWAESPNGPAVWQTNVTRFSDPEWSNVVLFTQHWLTSAENTSTGDFQSPLSTFPAVVGGDVELGYVMGGGMGGGIKVGKYCAPAGTPPSTTGGVLSLEGCGASASGLQRWNFSPAGKPDMLQLEPISKPHPGG